MKVAPESFQNGSFTKWKTLFRERGSESGERVSLNSTPAFQLDLGDPGGSEIMLLSLVVLMLSLLEGTPPLGTQCSSGGPFALRLGWLVCFVLLAPYNGKMGDVMKKLSRI